jgi:pimeloyl-ACP methyl ester carboxylesterase
MMAPKDSSDAAARPEEDQPIPLSADLPAEIASPLAPFGGRRPPAPAWFETAIADQPERAFVEVSGAKIETLTWGERGKPGLVLVHGNTAHADWWSFIAPFLADSYRVTALSLSGMGGSDWRETYSFGLFAEEIHEAAKAAGLYEAPVKPIYIGHSFGGAQVLYSAQRHPERMRAAILVDTGFGGPPTPEEFAKMRAEAIARGEDPGPMDRLSTRGNRNRVYPSEAAALARFRLMPPQVPGNLFIADFIARGSLKRVPLPEAEEGSGEGWTWRFDPALWTKLDRTGMEELTAQGVATPMVHVIGDRSTIIRRHLAMARNRGRIPPDVPQIVIPDSEHHIMIDQPIALISVLRSLLATWAPA